MTEAQIPLVLNPEQECTHIVSLFSGFRFDRPISFADRSVYAKAAQSVDGIQRDFDLLREGLEPERECFLRELAVVVNDLEEVRHCAEEAVLSHAHKMNAGVGEEWCRKIDKALYQIAMPAYSAALEVLPEGDPLRNYYGRRVLVSMSRAIAEGKGASPNEVSVLRSFGNAYAPLKTIREWQKKESNALGGLVNSIKPTDERETFRKQVALLHQSTMRFVPA